MALFSTDERWGWRMGGSVFTVTMLRAVRFTRFIVFHSFSLMFSAVNQRSCAFWPSSAWLVLIHRLWEHGQDSSPVWGALKALNVFFFAFLFVSVKDAPILILICGTYPVFRPSIFLGQEPFSPSPPDCDSTCQLGWQTRTKERQLIKNQKRLSSLSQAWRVFA